MKKLKGAAAIILCMMLAVGCNRNENGSMESPPEVGMADTEIQGTALEFFPFLENTQYIYTGDTVYSDQEVYITFINDNKMQRRVSAFGYEGTEVFEYADGAITAVYAESRWYNYNDLTDGERNFNKVILQEPIQLGNSWETYSGNTTVGNLRGTSTITGVNVPVTTPYGTFEAIEVTTEYTGVNHEREYFVKGIGIVKTEYYTQSVGGDRFESTAVDVTIELSELNRGVAHEIDYYVYYPNNDANYFEESEATIRLYTNDLLTQLLEEHLKEPFDNGTVLLTENTKINSIEVNRINSSVILDLSQDYIEELNAGSGYELLLVESLALTFLDFFDVLYFGITIEGGDYSSGHLIFSADDFLTVEGILGQYGDGAGAED